MTYGCHIGPWNQESDYDEEYKCSENVSNNPFDIYSTNTNLDLRTKEIVLEVSPSVVSIVTHSGDKLITRGSGTIIECSTHIDGLSVAMILTSATLVRCRGGYGVDKNQVADNLEIDVFLRGGSLHKGNLEACDFHYNMAVITIESRSQLQAARCRCVKDGVSTSSSEFPSHGILVPHTDVYTLTPGDQIIALGRYFRDDYRIMAAPGKYSLTVPRFDCKELLAANCKITKCGIGGPIVNFVGDVIGISFYDEVYTPFLPVNLVSKWWNFYKTFKKFRRPYLGIRAASLYAASLWNLDWLRQKNVVDGIIIEAVKSGSPWGLKSGDVIIQCCGKRVSSFIQFFEMIWDKVGETVEVELVRKGYDSPINKTIFIDETRPDHFYRWRLPKKYARTVLKGEVGVKVQVDKGPTIFLR